MLNRYLNIVRKYPSRVKIAFFCLILLSHRLYCMIFSIAWKHFFEKKNKEYLFVFSYLDQQSNPYKPTYTFPEELDGDLKRMEDYIRRAASESLDDDDDSKINKTMKIN